MACLALLLLSPSPAAADPAEGQAAAPLTVDSDTWTEAIIESPQPAFVYYRGTHGGPGDESIMKQLAELASKHSGISVVALVECSDKGKGDALCRDASLTRVPAMKVRFFSPTHTALVTGLYTGKRALVPCSPSCTWLAGMQARTVQVQTPSLEASLEEAHQNVIRMPP